MKHVLFYEFAADAEPEAATHYAEHRARLDECFARGTLLMVGAFANPREDGSMGIFTDRGDAEAFVAGDPFVLNGVVRNWRTLDWDDTSS
jgi:uncharacterized protein YciI